MKREWIFYGGENKKGTGHNAKPGKLFKELYDKKNQKDLDRTLENNNLKGACKTAYSKSSTEIDEEEVKKYCGLLD